MRKRGSVDEALNAMPPGFRMRARAAGAVGAFDIFGDWRSTDERQGWAVGNMGTILKLTEGGGWVVDPQGSAVTRRSLSFVAFDRTGTQGLAVGEGRLVLIHHDDGWRVGPNVPIEAELFALAPSGTWGMALGEASSAGDSPCLSTIWRAGAWTEPVPCLRDHPELDSLRIVDGKAWLRVTERCPERDDLPFQGTHLLRWDASGWAEVAVCEPPKHGQLVPPPAPPKTGLALEREPLGSVESDAAPGLALRIVSENQSANLWTGQAQVTTAYGLDFSVDHRATAEEIEALLNAAMQEVLNPANRAAYDEIHLSASLGGADDVVAEMHWGERNNNGFRLRVSPGSLQERGAALLQRGQQFDSPGMGWSGCPGGSAATEIVARGQHLTVTYRTTAMDPAEPECVFAIADEALTVLYDLSVLTVRLEQDGAPLIEMDFDPALFFEIDPYPAYLGRERDLHHAAEEHEGRRQKRELRKIEQTWLREVAWRFEPTTIRHYRLWDRPSD